jgi:hypothetical protein
MNVSLAILGSSLIASAMTTIALAALLFAESDGVSDDVWMSFTTFYVLSAMVTAALSATIGLAWHSFATSRGWTNVHAYWIPGAAFGLALALIVVRPPPPNDVFPLAATSVAAAYIYGVAQGGLTGLGAWLLRRPDRDTSNPAKAAP